MKIWRIHISIVLLFCMVAIFVPISSNACDAKSKQTATTSCATKKPKKEKQHKECCKTNSCKKEGDQKDYHSHCKDNTCGCTPSSVITLGLIFPVSQDEYLSFFQKETEKYFYQDAHISMGFLSIWLPPKIS